MSVVPSRGGRNPYLRSTGRPERCGEERRLSISLIDLLTGKMDSYRVGLLRRIRLDRLFGSRCLAKSRVILSSNKWLTPQRSDGPIGRPLRPPRPYSAKDTDLHAICDVRGQHDLDRDSNFRRTGVCRDNAVAESAWSSLKRELVHRYRVDTRAQARRAIFAWNNRYNSHRRHSTLGYIAPIAW